MPHPVWKRGGARRDVMMGNREPHPAASKSPAELDDRPFPDERRQATPRDEVSLPARLIVADDPISNVPDSAGSLDDKSANNGGGPVRGDSDRDVSVLKVGLNVPSGANCLSVDFQFLSEEYAEYVGQIYNDAFIAELDNSTWTTSGSTISAPDNFAFDPSGDAISVNSSGVANMTAANAAGTTYNGATQLLAAKTPITPGAHSLYLSIFDQGSNSGK
ncbi:hypothetical protein BH18ACT11_BH18ACT11_08330 [soil metagenome]